MITDVFFSYFVVAAFIFMTVTSWQKVIKVAAQIVGGTWGKQDSSIKELAFLFVVVAFLIIVALVVVWHLDKIATPIDKHKVETAEEVLETMEIVS